MLIPVVRSSEQKVTVQTMDSRTDFLDMFGISREDDPNSYNALSDYDIAVLRSRTGQLAITIRRAAMKVGSDPGKIEEELAAQKMNRG